MAAYKAPSHEKVWKNISFFAVITAVTFLIGPVYLWKFGITKFEIGLTLFYMIATGMGITVGYHRLFSHAAFQAHPIVRYLLLFFASASFEQSALEWSSQHRDHHRYVDTDKDPYSIKKGFWYAHVGWLVFWRHHFDFSNAQDLEKDPILRHQHKYYHLWAFVSGVVTPVVIGAMAGHALGAFVWAVCFRLVFVYNATFCINSVCHMFGNATYDIYSSAKDHWLVALITYGEGYHNFHHRFPSDYRNGVRWYHWDPSKWLISTLAFFKLATNLKTVSNFRIMEARILAENQRVKDWAAQHHGTTGFEAAYEVFRQRYEQLRQHLMEWEKASKEYQTALYGKLTAQSKALRVTLQQNLELAKERFSSERESWQQLIASSLRLAGV